MVIYKYKLNRNLHVQKVLMNPHAKIIHIALQFGELCVWAEVPDGIYNEDRIFHIIGTGHQFPQGALLTHHGTFLDGAYVWHIYTEAVPS